jgi:hypothetical protein
VPTADNSPEVERCRLSSMVALEMFLKQELGRIPIMLTVALKRNYASPWGLLRPRPLRHLPCTTSTLHLCCHCGGATVPQGLTETMPDGVKCSTPSCMPLRRTWRRRVVH